MCSPGTGRYDRVSDAFKGQPDMTSKALALRGTAQRPPPAAQSTHDTVPVRAEVTCTGSIAGAEAILPGNRSREDAHASPD